MYASLHNHTEKSNIRLLDAINRPKDLVEKALSLGFNGIAITDHESLSAAVDLLHIRDSIKKDHPDFKIIFGNEIYLVGEEAMRKYVEWRPTEGGPEKPDFRFYHFILWAKDAHGFQQLKELSSRAWGRSFMFRGQRRCPTFYTDIEEIVAPDPGHIMCATACLGSELAKAVADKDAAHVKSFVSWMIRCFGKENVRFELQVSDSEEQCAYNAYQIKLSKALGIPYVITTDSHYLNAEDAPIHKAFLNSKQGDREVDSFYKYTYMMSEDEMREILIRGGLSEEDIQTGFDNSAAVADAIGEFDFRHEIIVPKRQVPDFSLSLKLYTFGDKYPHIKLYYDSLEIQDRYLMYQIERGLEAKNVTITDKVLARLEEELDILWFISERLKQPMSAYLNLCQEIIDLTWKVSLVGVARGSCTGFYINYLIGITQVDPFDYDLWCQRFLNKERAEMPDIDFDSQPEKTDDIIKILRQEFGEDNVINCATFKTESLKSAILTCGRGLNYNNDEMQALAGMVPAHRGKTYNLKQCLEGDEEQGFEPVPGFEAKIKSYPGLLEAVRKIEGLSTNASIHASALYIFNNGYLAQNSLMLAPNGTKITAFTMHDSDEMGALKMDLLRTDAMSKIAKCLELMLKDHVIEWKGSLKATYNAYIYPDKLDYDNIDMWERMADGKIRDLFQMDTPQGAIAMKKARPHSVAEMGNVNAIMRLQSEGEQPIDRYMRFHKDPALWEDEMTNSGLDEREKALMRKYLQGSYGVSGTQEVMMHIVMDPEISAFTLGEANSLRKFVSKKIISGIQKMTALFFDKGEKTVGARRVFLEYVFKIGIEPQLGYAFSINHTVPYSIIGVQEAHLATHYNPLYWACACLCCNAGNTVQDVDFDEDEESVDESEETPQNGSDELVEASEKKKRAAPHYGKIAKAIDDVQRSGVEIGLPDINEAQEDFVPDAANNRIIYSLRTVNAMSDALFEEILAKRPFASLQDFFERIDSITASQIIGLVKAGCFDSISTYQGRKVSRGAILLRCLNLIAEKEVRLPAGDLTAAHIKKAIQTNMKALASGYMSNVKLVNFKSWIDKNQKDPAAKTRYLLTDQDAIRYFEDFVKKNLNADKEDYSYLPGGAIAVKTTPFKKYFDAEVKPLKDYFLSEEGRQRFLEHLRSLYVHELWEKYGQGTVPQWEMEQLCFYHGSHELADVPEAPYGVADFNSLPEQPVMETYVTSKGEQRKIAKTCALMGTIVYVESGRHTVWLLTTHGVVSVKFYSELFTRYKSVLSRIDPQTGKKVVLDRAWLKRGEKILVYGYRREDAFVARSTRFNGYPRTICRIDGVSGGDLKLKFSRDEESR